MSFSLRSQADTFFKTARKTVTPHFIVYTTPAETRKTTVVPIVPKKRLALATDRNRWKRRVRALKPSLEQQIAPTNVVVLFKKNIERTSFKDLQTEIITALQK